jgi:hypothetical protein
MCGQFSHLTHCSTTDWLLRAARRITGSGTRKASPSSAAAASGNPEDDFAIYETQKMGAFLTPLH